MVLGVFRIVSDPVKSSSAPDSRTFASVLGWQSRVRIVVAAVYAAATMGLQLAGLLQGSVLAIGATFVLYAALTLAAAAWARSRRSPVGFPVAIALAADLGFLVVMTGATSIPAYYSRVLILSFFLVHTSETYFGRAYAMLTLVGAALGYVILVATAAGTMGFGESLWSVLAFWATGSALVLHYGEIQRRLNRIIALFEGAAQGDFTQAYDVQSDRYNDSVTRVGRAYNRVQVQLADMVLNDSLTDCVNRRGFGQALAREVARAARARSELALLAIDLDEFKKVNDTFGHIGGDMVLRQFGQLLARAMRAGDIVARTGGEEFSILLPDTGMEGAERLATRLCDEIRGHVFTANGEPVPLTASIGVVATRPTRGEPDMNFQLRGDEALYAAKNAGRDCVRTWPGESRGSGAGQSAAVGL
jgi:diguanylate cyclase (GGDEF)-like protein